MDATTQQAPPKKGDGKDGYYWVLVLVHVALAPFTKVEESFNMQAMHDILYHGFDLAKYDHFEFPGVVPRTFIGSLFVALFSKPIQLLMAYFGFSKWTMQYIVRSVLGLILIFAFAKFKAQVGRVFGPNVAKWLAIVQMAQFHLTFYFSRSLPNTFALALVMIAYSYWLQGKFLPMIGWFTFTIVVFRSEVLLLFGPIILTLLVTRKIPIIKTILAGIIFGVISLATTVLIDSYFWGKWIWPEGEVLFFNTVMNKSHEWGTSPFYWYFLVAIPKTLMFTFPLVFVGLFAQFKRLLQIVVPIGMFLVLYSFLPHKELRFIFYVFPIFNMLSAIGMEYLFHLADENKDKKAKISVRVDLLIRYAIAAAFIATLASSLLLLYISSSNYPGGYAFRRLHKMESGLVPVHVHIDNAAAQTGVTRFGEIHHRWRYSKDEHVTDFGQFTHLITENATVPLFDVIGHAEGFDYIKWSWPPKVIRSPKIYIHKRIGFM
jgi:alpha-1,6-mannosyltransferase